MDQINNIIVEDDKLTDKQKSLISLNLAKTEKKLIDGADEYIQLLNVFSKMQQIYNNIKNL